MKKLKSFRILFFAVLTAALIFMTGCGGEEQTADPGIDSGSAEIRMSEYSSQYSSEIPRGSTDPAGCHERRYRH